MRFRSELRELDPSDHVEVRLWIAHATDREFTTDPQFTGTLHIDLWRAFCDLVTAANPYLDWHHGLCPRCDHGEHVGEPCEDWANPMQGVVCLCGHGLSADEEARINAVAKHNAAATIDARRRT